MQCLSNCIWFPLRERNVSYLQSNCKLLWGRLYYLYLNCERHYLQLCFHLSFCFVCKVNNSSPYFRIKETVAPDHREFFFFFFFVIRDQRSSTISPPFLSLVPYHANRKDLKLSPGKQSVETSMEITLFFGTTSRLSLNKM